MFVLIWILIFILPFWFFINFISGNKNGKHSEQPKWTFFIEEFKLLAPKFRNMDQLEAYLLEINETVKLYETDYDFLVEFNSTLRGIKENLSSKSSFKISNDD